MIQKILRSNTTYIVPAAIILLVGQFLYLDAQNRVQVEVSANTEVPIEETKEPTLFSLSKDALVATQVALTSVIPLVSTSAEADAILDTEENIETTQEEILVEEILEVEEISEPTEEIVTDVPAEEVERYAVDLPYFAKDFSEGAEWVLGYGTLSFPNSILTIGGGSDSAASLVLLEGGLDLEDYTYEVNFDWNRGASVSLIARFADFDNFVTCSFVDYGAQVSIVSQVEGERIPHNSSPTLRTKAIETWRDLTFGIRVFDGVVECLKEGEVVLRNTLSTTPEYGTVGIGIWAPNNGEALVAVKEVTIAK